MLFKALSSFKHSNKYFATVDFNKIRMNADDICMHSFKNNSHEIFEMINACSVAEAEHIHTHPVLSVQISVLKIHRFPSVLSMNTYTVQHKLWFIMVYHAQHLHAQTLD